MIDRQQQLHLILKKRKDVSFDLFTTFQRGGDSPENPIAHHIVYIDFDHERAKKCDFSPFDYNALLRVVVISINPETKQSHGPFFCGELRNEWTPFCIGRHVHVNAYNRWAREIGAYDSYGVDIGETILSNGLLARDWNIVWDLMNEKRFLRIKNRYLNPRQRQGVVLEDDILDIVLSMTIKRINALLNMRLYNGFPDNRVLSFYPAYNYPEREKEIV